MKGKSHRGHHPGHWDRMTTLRRFGPGPEGFGFDDSAAEGSGFGAGPRPGHGPGFGHGPGGFGPRHGFGPPFGGGRGRRRRGDVRIALLRALEDEPQNGYQLMQAIEDRTGGRWRPSPGSVYPALAQLEDQGFIRPTERDGQKLYEVTDEGRQHLEERKEQPAPWDDDDPAAQGISDVRSMIGEVAQAAALVSRVADEEQLQHAADILTEARRALYRILAEEAGESGPRKV